VTLESGPPAASRAPDTLLILALVALLVALAVTVVPPGRFAEVNKDEGSRQVSVGLHS
jgi:uncharacterized ion transporter superfamily protein YfcC